jgi:hypothetical protein
MEQKIRIAAANIIKKDKFKYFGLNSKLVEKILENNTKVEISNPPTLRSKILKTSYFRNPAFESENIQNKFNHNNEYRIQYFKL